MLVAVFGLTGALVIAPPAGADGPTHTGHVVSAATGDPVAGACVTAFDTDRVQAASACTGADGAYSMPDLAENAYYKFRATAPGYAEMWAFNKGDEAAAEFVFLGGDFAPFFALRQGTGVLAGQVTEPGGASPAGGVTVVLFTEGQTWSSVQTTGADGRYSFSDLTPVQYLTLYERGAYHQWGHQREEEFSADRFTVADGQTTVVDEELLPLGSLTVAVTDQRTHRPVAGACVGIFAGVQANKCTDAAGIATFDGLTPTGYSVSVDGGPTHFVWTSENDGGGTVNVPRGPAHLDVALRQAAALGTTVRDASTGAPVDNACLNPIPVTARGVPDGYTEASCTSTGQNAVIGQLQPGTYNLLVAPNDGVHGMQWLGANGGTGDRRDAVAVTARAGRITALPGVRLDRAGTISGVVRDKATGAGINLACVYVVPLNPQVGVSFGTPHCTASDGRYTIAGLGPYDWRVEFVDTQSLQIARYAWQWNGGAPDRFSALPVRVSAGQTITVNADMVPGARITGHSPSFSSMWAYNAQTGDFAASGGFSQFDGLYELTNLATQNVKIEYSPAGQGQCWYPAVPDFRRATPIPVTAGQTTNGIDLTTC
jgi:hypothetical protein